MYDRPNLSELLDAARGHMEDAIIPAVRANRKLYFQTLVAINVLKIAERELAMADDHMAAEWAGLNQLTRTDQPAPPRPADCQRELATRNAALCNEIRAGAYDDPSRATVLFEHLIATTVAQLEVANPRFLQSLVAEDAANGS